MDLKRILLIENELVVAAHLTELLVKLGHQVVGTVVSGREGVLAAKTTQPDLILMNVILEGTMDGYEAARQIRLGSATPILFVTGRSEKYSEESAGALGSCLSISKPFSSVQISKAIHVLFSEQARPVCVEKVATRVAG